MTRSTTTRRRATLLSALTAGSLLAVSAGVSTVPAAASTPSAYTAGNYIVTFVDEPIATYTGYERGYAATAPARGKKVDRNARAAVAWRDHLVAKHDRALATVGAAKEYDYTVATNGVLATLTAKQAARLAKTAGVARLEKDVASRPDTTLSPSFLGLDAPGGVWSQFPGGAPKAGAGLVVGVLDTGIWPESPAFRGGTGIPVPADWHGACVAGEQFSVKNCNDKLVGARYYLGGFGRKFIAKEDFLSPRDGSGHGSHTASTAAGNGGTSVDIEGHHIGTGSGMAPGAKVAMYKVCWEGKGVPPGCFNSDSVAAVDDAVADGVDVINYSIGGSSESPVTDAVAQAFRRAANAGVFVANSAGNSGPGVSTLDHPAPWVTTVAAATFRRAFQVVELGNGARYVGASTTPSYPTTTPLVTATSVKLAAAADDDAAKCFAGTLDPTKAAGKVVLCDRGVNARIDKSFEVKRAGGVAMVLANTSPNSLNGDFHPVPGVHIDDVDGAAVKAYVTAAGAAATAKIVPLTAAELAAAPQVPEITDFSSRGPSTTTEGDILKPDIAAPGNDVVAAAAPPSNHGRIWDFMSGTSMASPHIAGIGALIKALHPTWTPAEIKSALMTTTRDTVSSATDPFAQGAGFVDPNGAADPGLVYPTDPNEWRQYLVGYGVVFAPPFDTLTEITGTEINQASIAVGRLAGARTITRRVKNVGTSSATYSSSVNLPGFEATVSPPNLTLAPGAEGTFTLTLLRDTAPLGDWAVGALTWTDGDHVVRSPITVKPVAVAAPPEIHGDASASGSEDFEVTPGFTGTLQSSVSGLVGVTPIADSVGTSEFDIDAPAPDAGTKKYSVVVPAGTRVARFSLDSADDTADLDVFVYLDGELVDLSASGQADEQVTILDPAEGTYDVYVNGFTTPGGSTSYGLSNFVVGAADLGNAAVTPGVASVDAGDPITLTASWSGLDPAKRWLGLISYLGADDVTLFSVG